MTAIHRTEASLRFFGDDLDPDEVTRVLGSAPTVGVKKGSVRRSAGGRESIARRGSWLLKAEERRPGDLDAQIQELLSGLNDDLNVWSDLASRFQADIFCGIFLACSNEGEELRPETMAAIGLRRLRLGLDIYGPDIPD
jgi:hypothetical protein